jgi:hypothetical protein
MLVRRRVIYISDIKIVPVSDSYRILPMLLNDSISLTEVNSAVVNVWLDYEAVCNLSSVSSIRTVLYY